MKRTEFIRTLILFLVILPSLAFSQKFYYDTIIAPDGVKVITHDKEYTRLQTDEEIKTMDSIKCMAPHYVNIDTIPIDIEFSTDESCSADLEEFLMILPFLKADVKNDTLFVSEIIQGTVLFWGVIKDDELIMDMYSYRLILEEFGIVQEKSMVSFEPIEYDTIKQYINGPGDTLEIFHYEIISSVNKPPDTGSEPGSALIQQENNQQVFIFSDYYFDIINIDIPENACLEIIDLTGKSILNMKLKSGKNSISASDIDSGIYIARVLFDDNSTPVAKIIYLK